MIELLSMVGKGVEVNKRNKREFIQCFIHIPANESLLWTNYDSDP